jgi:hypothetical protein
MIIKFKGLNDDPLPVAESKVHPRWDTGKIQWGWKSRKRRSAEEIAEAFWFDSIWDDGPTRVQVSQIHNDRVRDLSDARSVARRLCTCRFL